MTPIFKKGNRSCPANYRPVSLWHQYAARYANTSSSPRPCATYNIASNVIGWIASFLSNRTQKVVVDGYESSVAPVLQASHKAPSWAPCSSWSSSMTFQPTCHQLPDYSLMTACYTADCVALQADLNKLLTWSHTWGMEFKVAKCNILTLTNKVKHQVKYPYRMEGEVVKSARSTPYLGGNC